jgi:hypothetical protein
MRLLTNQGSRRHLVVVEPHDPIAGAQGVDPQPAGRRLCERIEDEHIGKFLERVCQLSVDRRIEGVDDLISDSSELGQLCGDEGGRAAGQAVDGQSGRCPGLGRAQGSRQNRVRSSSPHTACCSARSRTRHRAAVAQLNLIPRRPRIVEVHGDSQFRADAR